MVRLFQRKAGGLVMRALEGEDVALVQQSLLLKVPKRDGFRVKLGAERLDPVTHCLE